MIDLNKIRSEIESKRDAILSKIKRLRHDDPFAQTDRSLIVEPGTDASALFGHEQVVVLEGKLRDELKEIERALTKVKKGTYGVCEKCGKQIDIARLMAKPTAIYCLRDEREMEKKKR